MIPPTRKLITLLAACACLGLSACGGDSADEERLEAEKLAQAKAEGAREAEEEARIEAAEEEAAEAKREVARIKKQRTRTARRKRATAPTSSGSSGGGGGGSSCGDGLSVNGSTSCPFARAVKDSFESSGGASVIEAYSPTTGQLYTMTCARGIPTVCRGGNDAVVYIR